MRIADRIELARTRYSMDCHDVALLAKMRYAADAENKWITLEGGTHVQVDKDGAIVGGPAGLADKGIKHLDDFGKSGNKPEKNTTTTVDNQDASTISSSSVASDVDAGKKTGDEGGKMLSREFKDGDYKVSFDGTSLTLDNGKQSKSFELNGVESADPVLPAHAKGLKGMGLNPANFFHVMGNVFRGSAKKFVQDAIREVREKKDSTMKKSRLETDAGKKAAETGKPQLFQIAEPFDSGTEKGLGHVNIMVRPDGSLYRDVQYSY